MSAVLRFAPSPTGFLHVGNARMALINGLLATHLGGHFILRMDDTDAERSKAEYATAIERDLAWMGLSWDRVEHQSARLERYQATFDALVAAGRLYRCFETSDELDKKRKRQMARKKPPIYDRAGLSLSDDERVQFEAEGRKPHWRFKLNHAAIEWDDMVRGPQHFDGTNLSDPVLVREDGTFLYMLPSAVDDMDMAITHVVRGEDHVANTAIQIQLFEALGGTPPTFAHLPLMTDISGGGLSKRLGSLTLESLSDEGIEPLALASYLAHVGTSDAILPAPDLGALARDFDITHFGRAQPKFDRHQLDAVNAAYLHGLSFEAVAERLQEMGLAHADAALWEAVRPNLNRLSDVALWHGVCFGSITPVIEDADLTAAALSLLPPEPWDAETWKTWTGQVKDETGKKGKALFMPLRLALTGLDHGPELRALLPLIGRTRAHDRLLGKTG